jgi:hypothetical protein
MLAQGWLEREGVDEEAYRFLEGYEDLAQGDNFTEDGEDIFQQT